MGYVTFKCDNCGKVVTKKRRKQAFINSKHHFCSWKCYKEYSEKHPEEFPRGGHDIYSYLVSISKNRKQIYGEQR